MKPETERWVDVVRSDLEVAALTLERGYFQHTVFHCQQSVEKVLKAIWVERRGEGTHPRIHNLPKLAALLALEMPSREWNEFLVDLTDQIFPSRYPESGGQYDAAT